MNTTTATEAQRCEFCDVSLQDRIVCTLAGQTVCADCMDDYSSETIMTFLDDYTDENAGADVE